MVTLVIPAALLYRSGGASVGGSLAFPWSALLALAGAGLSALGLVLMARSIALFHRVGGGTLAPWNPTARLVVRGVYRHVRNPMISGVLCVLLGEGALFGSPALLAWFGLFAALNAIYIPLFEEPGLERRFGADYLLYKRNVPRWIPRLRPWGGLPGG
jgi:protein-S-isoprenylcysteine O-methyltransferase Ste14